LENGYISFLGESWWGHTFLFWLVRLKQPSCQFWCFCSFCNNIVNNDAKPLQYYIIILYNYVVLKEKCCLWLYLIIICRLTSNVQILLNNEQEEDVTSPGNHNLYSLLWTKILAYHCFYNSCAYIWKNSNNIKC
jgi:hypothetical protein